MRFYFASIGLLVLFCASLHAGNFQINQEASSILVDSRASPPHTVTSYVRQYESDIQIDPDTLAVSSATFSFKMSDVDSEHKKRDKKMHTWFDSKSFPKIEFNLSEVVKVDGQTVGKGTLSMHGISKSVEVPFSVTKNGKTVTLDGTADFSYMDWDLEIIKLFIFKVRPELKVKFHLEGSL